MAWRADGIVEASSGDGVREYPAFGASPQAKHRAVFFFLDICRGSFTDDVYVCVYIYVHTYYAYRVNNRESVTFWYIGTIGLFISLIIDILYWVDGCCRISHVVVWLVKTVTRSMNKYVLTELGLFRVYRESACDRTAEMCFVCLFE